MKTYKITCPDTGEVYTCRTKRLKTVAVIADLYGGGRSASFYKNEASMKTQLKYMTNAVIVRQVEAV